jgi:hypothetical protein
MLYRAFVYFAMLVDDEAAIVANWASEFPPTIGANAL